MTVEEFVKVFNGTQVVDGVLRMGVDGKSITITKKEDDIIIAFEEGDDITVPADMNISAVATLALSRVRLLKKKKDNHIFKFMKRAKLKGDTYLEMQNAINNPVKQEGNIRTIEFKSFQFNIQDNGDTLDIVFLYRNRAESNYSKTIAPTIPIREFIGTFFELIGTYKEESRKRQLNGFGEQLSAWFLAYFQDHRNVIGGKKVSEYVRNLEELARNHVPLHTIPSRYLEYRDNPQSMWSDRAFSEMVLLCISENEEAAKAYDNRQHHRKHHQTADGGKRKNRKFQQGSIPRQPAYSTSKEAEGLVSMGEALDGLKLK